MTKLDVFKFISLLVLLSALVTWFYVYDFDIMAVLEDLRRLSAKQPLWAAVLFILAFTLVKFTFVPVTSASILAGYLFGGWLGVALSVAAIAFSSAVMFALARYLGRSFIRRLIADKMSWLEKYDARLERHGFGTVLFFRVVPVLPLAAINLGLGVSRVRFGDYMWATVAGVLPGVTLLSHAGKHIGDWDNYLLYLYLGIYILFIGIAFWLGRKHRKKHG